MVAPQLTLLEEQPVHPISGNSRSKPSLTAMGGNPPFIEWQVPALKSPITYELQNY